MARDTDFLVLYRILGLNHDCGLDDLKRAYRRRVSVLHPDRRTDQANQSIAAERLQQLSTLYNAAIEFHRQHGRLPGSQTARADTVDTPTWPPTAPTPATLSPTPATASRQLTTGAGPARARCARLALAVAAGDRPGHMDCLAIRDAPIEPARPAGHR